MGTCFECGSQFYFDPKLGRPMKCPGCLRPRTKSRRTNEDILGKPLSSRDKHVIALLHNSLSNKEIAAQLGLSAGSVKTYLVRIMDKLGAANRTDVVVKTLDLMAKSPTS